MTKVYHSPALPKAGAENQKAGEHSLRPLMVHTQRNFNNNAPNRPIPSEDPVIHILAMSFQLCGDDLTIARRKWKVKERRANSKSAPKRGTNILLNCCAYCNI
jgi:hypothetical protein